MKPKSIAIVGAAETTRLGVIPDMSQIQLHADAALNAMVDAGLKPSDIDGIATAGETPTTIAHYLGLTPKWVDGTAVGGCSFMIHTRHAAAAIASGLCDTVLITHGESGRSGVGRTRNVVAPTSLAGQFEQPYGPMGPPTLFTIPVSALHEDLWLDRRDPGDGLGGAARMGGQEPARHLQGPDHRRGRAELADDRLSVPIVAVLPGDRWRGRLNSHFGRARQGFPDQAGLHPRHRRERRDPDGQPDEGFHLVERVPRLGRQGLRRGRHHPQRRRPSDDLRRLCPSADLRPRRSGLCRARRGRRRSSPSATPPPAANCRSNTNGGGLSYMHSGMYGMYALQESVRQMRGIAPAQIPGAKVSVCHGVGGMFAASGTIIMSNEGP